ncbi:LIP1 Lipase 1 [Candida maltosa Xu316]|uniref:Lipase n=1 Tax=Candida maltosa (strain Xu316) TaxID=1245528 RepID=M3HRP6_CANMX|nr:Lipase 1 [Candida maltosa Xu316]
MKVVFVFLVLIHSVVAIILPNPLIKPARDEFYVATPGFEATEPGTILKIRPTPHRLKSLFFHVPLKNSWQLLVRSEDSRGDPTAIVTTIFEPQNSNPTKILSYQTFEDASNINCSPSFAFQAGSPFSTFATSFEMNFMVPALKNGYFVVSPDYEGPRSAFTAGIQSGQAVLDSIRAVLRSGNLTGISGDAQVAMWGYSGGSLASGWAASLQPTYAPELSKNLIGAALGGFVTNFTATAEATDGTVFSGIIPLGLHGLGNEYPEIRDLVNREINPKRNVSFQRGVQKCLLPALAHFRGRSMLEGRIPYFIQGFGLLDDPVLFNVIRDNSLIYHLTLPQIPIFVYHGKLDAVVPIKDVIDIFHNWCDSGMQSFEFAEDITNGHISEQIIGAPAAWTWIKARFDGFPAIQGCTHTRRLTNLKYENITKNTLDFFYKLRVNQKEMLRGMSIDM